MDFNISAIHLHLILNHLASIGTLITFGLAVIHFFIPSSITKSTLFVLAFIFAVLAQIAHITGERSHDIIVQGNITESLHELIEHHEHAAERWGWLNLVLLFASILAFLFRNRAINVGKYVYYVWFIILSTQMLALIYISYYGGMIRHSF